ncbi:hypothetical protein SUDANB146_04157 [Streptomyces sp. enrichment culture]
MLRPAHAPGRSPEDGLLRRTASGCPLAPAVLPRRAAPSASAAGAACGPAAVTAVPRLPVRRSPRRGTPSRARAHAPRDAGRTPAG